MLFKTTGTRSGSLKTLRSLMMAATLLTAFSGIASTQSANSLVIARNMDINSLDPHRTFCDTCQIYDSAVYEGLLSLDKDNKVVPVLAESYAANGDQTEFTFKINPKAVFSDGSRVEAKDVKWSWERLKNVKGSPSFLADTIASIETPDEATVVVKTRAPNSEFFNVVASPYFGIVNSDVATTEAKAENGADAAEKDNAEAWFLAHSAGSGPFVLSAYEPNSELRLKRNEKYWREAPKVDEVIFRQVKDAVAQAQMLENGTADIAMQIDPETAKTFRNKDIKVDSIHSYNFIYLALSPGAKSNAVPLTADIREAISIAIDRESLLDFMLGDKGQLIGTAIPIGFPGGTGHKIPEYNPEKAKELLAKAGHPNGFTLEAVYPNLNVYGVDFTQMMQKIQQDLSQINVKVELQPVPFASWREKANGDGIPMTAVYYAPDFFGTSQYVDAFGLAKGSLWAKRAGEARDPSFVKTEIPQIMADALRAPLDEADKVWFKAGEAMAASNVIIPMLSPDVILAYNNRVNGVRYSACCNLPLQELSVSR
ncbi:glutathione-binding protein gsiB [Brucella abortus]|uniref:ABC transporter substrate-binding protein n=1 Tax=Brucella abortus TaxID=235 RepID=UPI000E11ED60|nr:ABC transporter substrate-binding protein [Brucella abortus]SUW36722.1 glutathione-binding protein gsiB [Brucella abortus]